MGGKQNAVLWQTSILQKLQSYDGNDDDDGDDADAVEDMSVHMYVFYCVKIFLSVYLCFNV